MRNAVMPGLDKYATPQDNGADLQDDGADPVTL